MSATPSRSARACFEAARESRASVEALQISIRRGHRALPLRRRAACRKNSLRQISAAGAGSIFTCIGPAINLAARLEKLTGKLHRTVGGVGRLCRDLSGWLERSRASCRLPVFSKAARVFGLMDEDADADSRPVRSGSLGGLVIFTASTRRLPMPGLFVL